MRFSAELRQKLAVLNGALTARVKDDAATVDQITAKTAEIETMNAKLTAQVAIEDAEDAEAAEAAKAGAGIIVPTAADQIAEEGKLYSDAFYNALCGQPLTAEQNDIFTRVNNALSSGTSADGGYLIPVDQRTAIKELMRSYFDFSQHVNIEMVSTLTGSRNIEVDAAYTAFATITEGGDLAEVANPTFENITYAIVTRGGILPVPNTLLKDEKANLSAHLNSGWP